MFIATYFSEIMLKGGNRRKFSRILIQNIQQALHKAHLKLKITNLHNRFLIKIKPNQEQTVINILRKISGIDIIMPTTAITPYHNLDQLGTTLLTTLAKLPLNQTLTQQPTFALRVNRVDKTYPHTSPHLERELGGLIKEKYQLKIQLTKPELKIHLELLPQHLLIGTRRIKGISGLPTSSSGKIICLLSGGIDSPVAAYHMMNRGAHIHCLHFHTLGRTSNESLDKVRTLAHLLADYNGGELRVSFINVLNIQDQITKLGNTRYRTLLFKRIILEIATHYAQTHHYQALLTGDSLGQVASQTLPNLHALHQNLPLPLLQPLIGTNKTDIITSSQKLGLFTTSILPFDDCCTLFTPTHPITTANPKLLLELMAQLNTTALITTALAEAQTETFH